MSQVPDDADTARALLLRAARQPRFLARLASHCARRASFFAPAREQRDLRRAVAGCLAARAPQPARRPTQHARA